MQIASHADYSHKMKSSRLQVDPDPQSRGALFSHPRHPSIKLTSPTITTNDCYYHSPPQRHHQEIRSSPQFVSARVVQLKLQDTN